MNHFEYWSWLLSVVGAAGVILTGKKDWRGWVVGVVSEILWFIYAIITKQYGFIFGCILYTGVFIKNLNSWLKEYRIRRIRRFISKRNKRRAN